MRHFFRWLWCWMRDHPYPTQEPYPGAYQAWLDGEEPFAPDVYCSHCGADLSWHGSRGMHS